MPVGLNHKHVVLGVSGGIAAYKSVELLRLLIRRGASVRVIMTRNAQHFVGWMTFEALSGLPVCTSLFEKEQQASIKHIDWAQEADLAVVAPATANVIGKLANGIADDALTTFMLAVTAPVVVCPSMNTNMYNSAAVQRNLQLLKDTGTVVLEPGSGELACGTTGPGRLPAPEFIADRLAACLSAKDFSGKRVLVTAGPTREAIDPVRYISNPSTGKMGFAVARAAEHRGASVTLISGPTALADPANVQVIRVQSAAEMATAVFQNAEAADIVIKTAAVSDYRPVETADQKIKKARAALNLELEMTTDILKELGNRNKRQILVGFAAETGTLEHNATEKLKEKNLDMIAANLIGEAASGFGADTNKVTLFYRDGTREPLAMMDKEAVAHTLLDRIVEKVMGAGDKK